MTLQEQLKKIRDWNDVILTDDPGIRLVMDIFHVFNIISRDEVNEIKHTPWYNDYVYLLNERDRCTEIFVDATNSQFERVFKKDVKDVPFIDIISTIQRIATTKETEK